MKRIRKSLSEESPQAIVERFKKFYVYNSTTGNITKKDGGRAYERKLTAKGYKPGLSLTYNGVEYMTPYARLCWLLYYGTIIPNNLQIDHKNNIKTDNSINNLQLLSNAENAYKRNIRKASSSKYKGVSYNKEVVDGVIYPNYVAVISKDNNLYKIGRFKENEGLAAKFYDAANRYLFKELSLTNFEEVWSPPNAIEDLRDHLKDLKRTMPNLLETEGLKEKLDELLERYGYPKVWKTMPISSEA